MHRGWLMARRALTIFLSSTSSDLQDYRAAARNTVLEMEWLPRMMEHFGAMPETTVKACYSMVDQCDAMLLIVGFQRGWVPTVEQGGNGSSSITALELEHARKRNIPVLVMMASESWPQNLCERDEPARAWVGAFRKDLNLPAEFFDYEAPTSDESKRLAMFRSKVRNVLLAHRERIAEQLARAERPAGNHRENGKLALRSATGIPFIGPGVYGDGPLSTPALFHQMWPDAPADQRSLATAAEFYERSFGSRELFLIHFAKLLSEQAGQAHSPPAYDLIAKLAGRPPLLLVSASHDMILETKLSESRNCAVVSHILRSCDAMLDGKVLVTARGRAPEICPADKMPDLRSFDLVIYKPLGSPFLHEGLDPELGIDTVVVTETDHLTFLGRLEHEHTRVPLTFHRTFQTKTVVFLGLQLDLWHYRLVLQVFRSVELKSGKHPPLAVRIPGSTMESMAWEHLGAGVIHEDPNEFASAVLEDRP